MNLQNLLIDPTIFRAYDIRGVVGETLTEEVIFLIGKVLGTLVREKAGTEMAIARDGRLSSPALTMALSEGIMASGCDVLDLGMVPTPLLYYGTCLFDSHSGVMLTGSHNPSNYNGLKMVVDGKSLTSQEIQNLHHRLIHKLFIEGDGNKHELDITDRYITHLAQNIRLAKPLHIVIDAGNGVTGKIAPSLFRTLGCEVEELYCDVDGTFPHHHPDPSQPEHLADLIRTVQDKKADLGLAFDGDGDRLGVVTEQGEIIWPDRLLMLFAKDLLAYRPQAKIIYDVKCTHHLGPLITSLGGEPIMWKTGHSLIKAKLSETKAELAGEMSGHFFFRDRWYGFDDALYAGARVLEIFAKNKLQNVDPFADIPNSVNTPELKVSVPDEEKFALMEQLIAHANFNEANEMNTIDGLRVNFNDGWGLVRASNTTPYLILRFEAMNQGILTNIQNLFRKWLLSVKADLVLPF